MALEDSLSLQLFLHFLGFFMSTITWLMSILMSTGWSTENLQLYLKWICGLQRFLILVRLGRGVFFSERSAIGQDQHFCRAVTSSKIFCALTDFQDTEMMVSGLKCRWDFQRDRQRSDSSYCWFPSRAEHCPDCYKEHFHNLTQLEKQKQKILEFFPFLQLLRRKHRGINWILVQSAHEPGFHKISLSYQNI